MNDIAKACIKAARKVESEVRFWEVEARMGLLTDRHEDEAYLAARPGQKYILYFTDGGSVKLDLTGHAGEFALRWVDIKSGDWGGGRARITGGGQVAISAPGKGGWAATIVRQN